MNTSPDQRVSTALRALCGSSDPARRLFGIFAQRQRDARETTVDRAAWLAGVDYTSMVHVFKELANIGVGRFIPGRHGYVSRMEWKFSIRSLGKVAQGRSGKLDDVAADADTEDATEGAGKSDLIDHDFLLRAGLKVRLSLPSDLTKKDVDRLNAFLSTLPI